nr:MAG TPA: hypothetical protein [Caudoviricetes sp.]
MPVTFSPPRLVISEVYINLEFMSILKVYIV